MASINELENEPGFPVLEENYYEERDFSMSSEPGSMYSDDDNSLHAEPHYMYAATNHSSVPSAEELGYGVDSMPTSEDLGYGEETQARRNGFIFEFDGAAGVRATQRVTRTKASCFRDDASYHSMLSVLDSSVDYSDTSDEEAEEEEDVVHEMLDRFGRDSTGEANGPRRVSLSFDNTYLTSARSAITPTRVDMQYGGAVVQEDHLPRRISLQFSQRSEHTGVSRKGCLDVSMGTSRLQRRAAPQTDADQRDTTTSLLRTGSNGASNPVRRTTMAHCQRPTASSTRTVRGITKNLSSRSSSRSSVAENETQSSRMSQRRTTMDVSLSKPSAQPSRRITMDMSAMNLPAGPKRRVTMDLRKSCLPRSNPGLASRRGPAPRARSPMARTA